MAAWLHGCMSKALCAERMIQGMGLRQSFFSVALRLCSSAIFSFSSRFSFYNSVIFFLILGS
jgi:hypothetical protein